MSDKSLVERVREACERQHLDSTEYALAQAVFITLAAEEAELRRDAERYRWLRDQHGYVLHSNPLMCDAEIDALMRGTK